MKHNIEIFGWNWQHWTDLIQNRWVFEWIDHTIIWEWQTQSSQITKAIIISISETKQLIETIIQNEQSENIINFSWVMSTTPESIRWNKWVENFHFLFWPKWVNNLKCAIAFEKELSPLAQTIVHNTKKQWISIIETSMEEHDKSMALIQWLNHLVRQLLLHCNIQANLPEINTTLQTVQDMILLNPHMDWVMRSLHISLWSDQVNLSDIFNTLIEENLTKEDIQNFSTPAFVDTLVFMRNNKVIVTNCSIQQYLKQLWL